MTVRGYRYTFLVCNQLSLLPRVGWEMSDSQVTVAVLCGREGNRRSGVALPSVHASMCYIHLMAEWHPGYGVLYGMAFLAFFTR